MIYVEKKGKGGWVGCLPGWNYSGSTRAGKQAMQCLRHLERFGTPVGGNLSQ